MTGMTGPPDGKGSICYRCAPDITWVRDAGQVLLVDADKGLSRSLRGVEAAIWDFLTLGYRYAKIIRFLSVILKVSKDEAKRTLVATLRGWQDEGIVQVLGDGCRGKSGD